MPSLVLQTVTCPRCGTTTTLHIGRGVSPEALLVCTTPSCRAVFPTSVGTDGGSIHDVEGYLTQDWIAAYGETDVDDYNWSALADAAGTDRIAPLGEFRQPPSLLSAVRACVQARLPG